MRPNHFTTNGIPVKGVLIVKQEFYQTKKIFKSRYYLTLIKYERVLAKSRQFADFATPLLYPQSVIGKTFLSVSQN